MAGQITYLAYDLMTSTLLAELPFGSGVSWGQKLNSVGQFKGLLNFRDPKVQKMDPYDATRPGRSMLAIDIDGSLVWLGIIWTRNYQSATGKADIGATEVWSYFNNRLQAQDYSNTVSTAYGSPVSPGNQFWNTQSADAQMIAAAMVADCLGLVGYNWTNAGQYGVVISPHAGKPFPGTALSWMTMSIAARCPNLVSPSYPIAQRQFIGSIVSMLSTCGYGTGFDFGVDVQWSNGTGSLPEAQLNFSYPRRGRIAGSTGTGLAIDSGACIDYNWPEDATHMMDSLVATAGGSANSTTTPQVIVQDTTPRSAGYPLLEGSETYSAVNTPDVLAAAADGDLAAFEWPVVTPTYTLPLWDDLYIGDFVMGDDIRVIQQPDDRFPAGWDQFLRIVANDVKIPDEGDPTMTLTLNMPIAAAPVPAPPL